jgi:pilus assembly protein Flp/PilA
MFKNLLAMRASIKEERGATAIEYALLVGLIAVIIIAAVSVLGTSLRDIFDSIVTALGGTPAA